MRSQVLATVTAAAVGAGIAGVAGALADRPLGRSFELIEVQSSSSFVPSGGARGNQLIYDNPLLDEDGTQVGTAHGVCTQSDLAGLTYVCASVFDLDGRGTLVVDGLYDVRDAVGVNSVTGGTGDFARVGAGEVTFADIPGTDNVRFSIRLR